MPAFMEHLHQTITNEMSQLMKQQYSAGMEWKCCFCPYTAKDRSKLLSHYQFHQQLLTSSCEYMYNWSIRSIYSIIMYCVMDGNNYCAVIYNTNWFIIRAQCFSCALLKYVYRCFIFALRPSVSSIFSSLYSWRDPLNQRSSFPVLDVQSPDQSPTLFFFFFSCSPRVAIPL